MELFGLHLGDLTLAALGAVASGFIGGLLSAEMSLAGRLVSAAASAALGGAAALLGVILSKTGFPPLQALGAMIGVFGVALGALLGQLASALILGRGGRSA